MTDQEILEKYREKIEKNIAQLFKKFNIEDEIKKQYFAQGYREGFVEGFREGEAESGQEIAKRMIRKGWPWKEIGEVTELNMEIVLDLAAEVGANLIEDA